MRFVGKMSDFGRFVRFRAIRPISRKSQLSLVTLPKRVPVGGKSVNQTRLLDNRVQLETHFVVFVGLLGEGKCDICLLDTCVANGTRRSYCRWGKL